MTRPDLAARVVIVSAEQQDDPAAQAHAADADHPAGQVGDPEPPQQELVIRCQRAPVLVDEIAQLSVVLVAAGRHQLPQRHQQGRAGVDPRPAIDGMRELPQLPLAVLRPGTIRPSGGRTRMRHL
ncbi:MAG: hypothetical protein ABJB47_14500 [Actinomycetota bacterium]